MEKKKKNSFRSLLLAALLIMLAAVPSVLYEKWDSRTEPDSSLLAVLFHQTLDEVETDWVSIRYDGEGNWKSTEISGLKYLSQSDARWKDRLINGYTVAKTGCTPAVGAMMLNRINDLELTPYDLGMRFHEWNYMNVNGEGSTPNVWKKTADEYDVRYKAKLSYEDYLKALRSGWIVILSVQGPPFTREPEPGNWISHTILVYGLNDGGYTNVMDPYSAYNTGTFRAQDLYEMRVKLFDTIYRGSCHAFAPK